MTDFRSRALPGARRLAGRRVAPLPAAACLVAILAGCGTGADARGAGASEGADGAAIDRTEILWDAYGVPHVFARNPEELFHSFGWAQARAHGDLILRLYGTARGRAAEYWGEPHLESDRWVRTVGIPARAARWYEAQQADFRRYLDAFAAGINDYAAAHPDRIADEVEAVLPVTGEDLLAHTQRVIHFTFVAPPEAVRAVARRWGAGEPAVSAAPASGPLAGGAADAVIGAVDAAGGAAGAAGGAGVGPAPWAPPAGSNAWALAPGRTEEGHALLLANPHLPWADLFTWFETQLTSPEVDAYGATLVGVPFLGIAFNDRLGWTHTVNTHDGADLYELELAGDGYRWDGGVRPFESREEAIGVRLEDGSLREERLNVRESVHGPVVARKEGKALALRVVGLEEPGMLRQYWDMVRAGGLEEFERILARLQMPMFTVMYADADGNILHLFGGRTPVRPPGEWDWSGIVPGDTSATLWTGTHPYGDLPRIANPASGWLQNANDPPWTTTFPRAIDPADFPAYMAPRGMAFRPQRSAAMLLADERVSLGELVAYKHSTFMELADRLLDDLLPAAREAGPRARRAASVLEAWDRSADAGSRGGVLFEAFLEELRRGGAGDPFAVPWDPEAPLETPDGVADTAAAVAALEAAAAAVEAAHGRLDVEWGAVHRLRRDTLDLPANGGPGELGIFRVVGYREAEGGERVAAFGDSWVAAVEFSDPVRARALLGYGNASQPGSPHRTDQLGLFAEQELRPVWRERAEIEAHLERAEVPRRRR